MKKILFLMFIMGVFSPLINAYEYVISDPSLGITYQLRILKTDDGILNLYVKTSSDGSFRLFNQDLGISLYRIKTRKDSADHLGYISNDLFQSYYKNDLSFLNDLYSQKTQLFLNYLYNDNFFNNNSYIQYNYYELLYNDDGLAVESIVDGLWAGLYDDSQKTRSGALYDKNGSLVYYNGNPVDPVTSFLVWLQKFTNKVVLEAFEEIRKSLVTVMIVTVIFVLGLVRLVLELLPASITPRRRRYYGGGRGSLPDYGDGSQVAASVRARLAAKNRALKARAYDRSGLEQSLQNSILFDLENSDR